MAGESIVGALRIILGMDTAEFEDGAKKAAKGVDSFGKKMTEIAAGLQLDKIIDKVTHAFTELTFGVVDTADKIGKASEKFGIGVETLSGLKYAAEQADVPFDSLIKSFRNMARSANEAASGTGIAAQAFKILGVNVKDQNTGALKPAEQLFLEVSDALSKFADGQGKASLAMAIFKKTGDDIIPLLNRGRDGIQAMLDRARALGLVLSKETTDAAQEFNDRLKDISAIAVGVATQFTANFLPAMQKVASGFVDWAINSDVVKKLSEALVRIVILLKDNMDLLVAAFKTWIALKIIAFIADVGSAIITLTRGIIALTVAKGILNVTSLATIARFAAIAAIFALVSGTFPALNEGLKKIGDTLAKLLPEGTVTDIESALKSMGIDISALIKDYKLLKDAAEASNKEQEKQPKKQAPVVDPRQPELLKKFNESLADLKTETLEVEGGFNQLAPGMVQAQKQFKDLDGFGKTLGTTLASLTPMQRAYNDELARLGRAKITQEFLSPWQQYVQQVDQLNAKFPEALRNTEAYALKSQQLALNLGDAWAKAAESIVGPTADAFKTLAGMNKKYAGAAKAFAIAEALINTYLAATKAYASLAYFPPLAIAAAAAATAAGLANVAKISATNFATGGSFKVAGGLGGIDSQMISFKATPGEMVDIRRPGQDKRATPINLSFSGGSAKGFFADNVRDLVDVLNKAAPDGYVIRIPT